MTSLEAMHGGPYHNLVYWIDIADRRLESPPILQNYTHQTYLIIDRLKKYMIDKIVMQIDITRNFIL